MSGEANWLAHCYGLWQPMPVGATGAFWLVHFHDYGNTNCWNAPLSNQNACSTAGDPDFWYATLWLTRNRKSSDPPLPLLYNFSIWCHLFFIWRNKTVLHFPSVKTRHPIRHRAGKYQSLATAACTVITSTHSTGPAFEKKTWGWSYGRGDSLYWIEAQTLRLQKTLPVVGWWAHVFG